jgi:Homeodomain-like domain-containing protein
MWTEGRFVAWSAHDGPMGYRGKLAERRQARQLRRSGLPLAEIATRLGVSKSSVSLWVRDVEFDALPRPPRGRRRDPNALQRRRQAEIDRLREEGWTRIGRLSEREFLVAGVAMYAGEGSKRDGSVLFANSDPRMIAFFCLWLRHFFQVDESRLRLRLYLHQGLDLAAAKAFWSALTGIPESQFVKPYRAVADPSIRNAKHVHGCVGVRYSCSATHRSIMGLVGALLGDAVTPG